MNTKMEQAVTEWLAKQIGIKRASRISGVEFVQITPVEGCESCGWGGTEGGAGISYKLDDGLRGEYNLNGYELASFITEVSDSFRQSYD